MEKLTIEAGKTERQYWLDLWNYRELFYFMAWRDLLVRYKQAVVGVAWSLIRPLLTMLITTLVFGLFAKIPAGGVPYPLMVFCGLLPWQFFATALTECGNSLVGNSHLISKVYFPRLVVPASSVIVSLVDFLISSAFLGLLLVWYRFLPPAQVVFLPLFMVLAFGAAFGAGLWSAALMVEYRDIRFIIPVVVQLGFYITPVCYPSSILMVHHYEKYQLLYATNPMVGIVDGFRWCLLGGEHTLYLPAQAISVAWVALLISTGIWYFRRTERTFADVI